MVCCILSCCTTLLLINWVIGILLVEFALMKTKAVRKVNEERDSKYPAFRRYDVHLWKRSRFYIGIIELLTFNFFSCILPSYKIYYNYFIYYISWNLH